MSATTRVQIRQRFYLDSVALMRASKTLSASDGVIEAAMMMGTPANIEIMRNASLLPEDALQANDIAAGDLIISVRADSDAQSDAAMQLATQLLDAPTTSTDAAQWRPRSIRGAMATQPTLNLALISVPGPFAISEARKAIRRGLNAMIFSDNVPIEHEAELKQEAQLLGKLVMGPDCGTAIINGVPLAFANVVPRGNIGIIGASGTGTQEVSCLIARAGAGISQAVGVGGRDLKQAVGGISTLMAMDMLERDNSTQHIVLIAKPAAPEVTAVLLARIAQSAKTFTLCLLGGEAPALPDNCAWATTLSQAAAMALQHSGSQLSDFIETGLTTNRPQPASQKGKVIRGLYCGGTLCVEAQIMLKKASIGFTSNVSVFDQATLDSASHTLIDLGDDEYTQGKPHPMIEPSIRDAAVLDALNDARVGVVLIDLVIGHGAHANPAQQFVAGLPAERNDSTAIIASVTGTEDDPQVRSRQMAILSEAGIAIAPSNEAASALAIQCVSA